MGISCRIYIRTPQDGYHRAGQPISGILSYAIDKPTEYETAVLSLIGKAKCKWREHKGRNSYSYTGKKVFLQICLNILNKPPEQTVLLSVGTYEFPFEFILPYEIPSSFVDKHSHITYNVKAKFETSSFFSLTKKFEKQVTVYGNVNCTTPAESVTYRLHKNLFRLFSSTEHIVDLKVQLAKPLLKPTEDVNLNLSVNNDSDKEIYITTKLRSRTTYVAEGTFSIKTKVVDETFEECTYTSPPVLAHNTGHFACVVPTLRRLYSIQYCEIVSKEFYVQVTIHLPFPHRNAKTALPVVIGEGRYGNSSETADLEDSFETGLGTSFSDLPPSYWEVMNEGKNRESKDKTKRRFFF